MKLKIPAKVRSLYEQDLLDIDVSNIGKPDSVRRDKEFDDINKRGDQDLIEKLFVLFTVKSKFNKEEFLDLLIQLYNFSEPYCIEHTFKGGSAKKPDNDQEKEMYFSPTAQKEVERIFYCSIILIPFYENKKLPKYIYNIFWGFFRKINKVDIEVKIEKIASGRYLSSGSDLRFWNLAEMYGLNKDQWLIDTLDILLSKSILKIEIGKSFAIYCQVLVRESLTFATKKNFTVELKVSETNKIINEHPDSFLNEIILEDELTRYVRENPHVTDIPLKSETLAPYIRYLCLVTLDSTFDVSADVLLRYASDTYYQTLVRQVVINILLKEKLFVLADLVSNAERNERESSRFFTVFKDPKDELLTKQITKFLKSIYDNSGQYAAIEIKSEMTRFIKKVMKIG